MNFILFVKILNKKNENKKQNSISNFYPIFF